MYALQFIIQPSFQLGRDEKVSKKDVDGRRPSTSRKVQSGRRRRSTFIMLFLVDVDKTEVFC